MEINIGAPSIRKMHQLTKVNWQMEKLKDFKDKLLEHIFLTFIVRELNFRTRWEYVLGHSICTYFGSLGENLKSFVVLLIFKTDTIEHN